MRGRSKFILLALILFILLAVMSMFLFGMSAIGVQGAKTQSGLLSLIPKLMIVLTIMSVMLGAMLAMYVFPVLSVVTLAISVVRHRRINWKVLRTPVFLLLASLIVWNLWSLFTNGSGYYFHHDLGSKVYNEGYIIPYYEKMYGDSLKLADKNVIDDCNAIYTLESGITGKQFTVETSYYDVGAGSMDRLHLFSGYGEILGERLEAGEKIKLPFNHGYSAKLREDRSASFDVWSRGGGYEINVGADCQEITSGVVGSGFYVSLVENQLVFEIDLFGGQVSIHRFPVENSE